MTDQHVDNSIETPRSEQPPSNAKWARMIGIAVGGAVFALSGFFIGYAVHGNSTSTTPSGQFPGGGQFPGAARGEIPGGGQFPGAANGRIPGGGQFPGAANGQLPGAANGEMPSAPSTNDTGTAR